MRGEVTKETTVAQIVTEDIAKAHVFKRFGIDFCCGGSKTLEEVCATNNVSIDLLMSALSQQNDTKQRSLDYNAWDLGFLIDYLLNVHHKYVKESAPILRQYATKVAKVHGGGYPELLEILKLLEALLTDLETHLAKEEQILFPYIKGLLSGGQTQAAFGTIQNPIGVMHAEHDEAGELMSQIRRLTNDYTPPEGACNSFRALYHKLDEFEQDLHLHVHIENNILFPKAVVLETPNH